ncbi:MAG: hypothetical protein QG604_608 [Candidatus Dependentiae bacterium]|nr:hypothetical protein [Candidatus Dependentiae bacterium]
MNTHTIFTLLLTALTFSTLTAATDDVVITAQKAGYTAFHEAVVAAGVYEHAKKDPGEKGSLAPFTVFVPTNEAFDGIKDVDAKKKKKLITFHVVPGKKIAKPADDMKSGVGTVGEQLLFAANDTVFLDDSETKAKITKGPIEARNGVLYVIDKVLLPAGEGTPKSEEPKKEEVKKEEKHKAEEPKKAEPAPVAPLIVAPVHTADTMPITERTAQALTASVTQLTQSIQLLIHVIQQAQAAEPVSQQTAPISPIPAAVPAAGFAALAQPRGPIVVN